MGGGSSVMGMIALRGTPDDYDEWAAAGATGWAWEDVLPWFRRLENDLDFDGPLHGKDGPVPIRRIPPGCMAAADARDPDVRGREADPVRRRHECGFPRRLWRAADEQSPRHAGVRCHVLSRPGGAPAPEPRNRDLGDRHRPPLRGPAGRRRRGPGRIWRADRPRPRNHPVRRRDPFAGDADARRHRPGGGAARARHRRGGRSPRRGREPAEPRDPVPGVLSRAGGAPARRACGRIPRPASAIPRACPAARTPTSTSTSRARRRGTRSAGASRTSRRCSGARWRADAFR